MTVTALAPELHDLAVALGILDDTGELRLGWFRDPIGQTKGMLDDAARRTSLGELIGTLIPADPSAPADHARSETWHPLTADGASQRVFLTTRPTADQGLALGLAAQLTSAAPADPPKPRMAGTLALGLVEAVDGGLRSIVGTTGSPIRASVDVVVDPTGAIGFEALALEVALTPDDAGHPIDVRVTVRGVRLDGRVLPSVVLDPGRLGSDAVPLLHSLLQDRLTRLASVSGAIPELAALAAHLLPVIGLGGDLPRLPIERIGSGPAVIADWFASVLDTAGTVWAGHLAGLLGAAGHLTGSGSETDSWRIPVADLGGDGRVELTLASRSSATGRELLVGVTLRLDGPAGVALDADSVLVSLPLTGTATARAVPTAAILLRAPGDPAATLVDTNALHVGFAQAGLRWDGTTVRPILELGGIQFEGHSYPVVDLSSVDSARAAAAEAARVALAEALGASGPGAQIATLAGLIPPPGDPGAPVIDPAALLVAPTRELARIHRARLASSDHPWSFMLTQLAELLGIADPVAGSGTAADPWRVPLAQVGPLTVELSAWATDAAGPASTLHLGVRVAIATTAGPATIAGNVGAEIVGLTLPASGPATTQLLAGLDAGVSVTGPFTLAPVAGIGLSLGGGDAHLSWAPGRNPALAVELTGLTVHVDDADVTLPALRIPPNLDPAAPDLGLGLEVDQLDQLVRALLSRLWLSVAGDDGLVLGGLLGLHLPDGADLPADWPAVSLPAAGLSGLLADPLEAVRVWLTRVAVDVSADGSPFVLTLLSRLRQLVSPDDVAADVALDTDIEGAGRWTVPWRVPLAGPASSELLLWLEPDGPPPSWAAAAAGQAVAGLSGRDLLRLMGRFGGDLAALAGPFGGPAGPLRAGGLTDGFAAMVRARSDGDGVVPVAAQIPADPAWTPGTRLVDAAHHRLPEHADTIAQVLAEVAVRAPGANRTVLLVGPPFNGRYSWQPLLAAAEAAQPGATSPAAHFDLRTAPSPDLADLQAITVAVPWYTADLADPGGDLGPVVDQLAAVVGRIRALRAEAPVVLVAHSTAGLAARAFAVANPSLLAGLITIGTPHGAGSLGVLDDPAEADALRLAARLLDTAAVTGPARDVVDHLLGAAEGWRPTATLPAAFAYPRDRFAGETEHGTGGVPALAIAGQIAGDLTALLGTALATVLTSGSAGVRTPTHLGVGVRVGRGRPAADAAATAVDVGFRADIARLSLAPEADPAVSPAQLHPPAAVDETAAARRLAVEIRVDAPDGFLRDPAGGAGVRVRRAELGVIIETGPGAGPTRASATFYDAAIDAPTAARVTLDDSAASRLLAALVVQLPTYGAIGTAVADALVALGVATRDSRGAVVVLADAVEGLRADAGAYLRARARVVLDSTPALLGFTGPPGGPWTADGVAAPLTLELAPDRLTVGLAGLELAGIQLAGEVSASRADPISRVALLASGASNSLRLDPAGPTLTLTVGDDADPVQLLPRPAGADLAGRLGPLLVERLAAAVLGAGLTDRLGPGWQLGSITQLLRHPERLLLTPAVAGQPPQLDGDRLSALLQALADALGQADGTGLSLPGGLILTAEGRPAVLTVRTEPPFAIPGVAGGPDGSVAVELDATLVDVTSLPRVAGGVTLDVPLGGSWGAVSVALGVKQGTVSLVLTPRTAAGPLEPIVLLPRFGGLGPLAADAAQALLPALLDALVARLPDPRPPLAAGVLAVADALGIHGGQPDAGTQAGLASSPSSFTAHVPQLRALAQPGGVAAMATTGLPAAVAQLWSVAGLPGSVAPSASGVAVSASFGVIGVTVEAGWGATPVVRLRVAGLAAGPIGLDPIVVGFADGAVTGALTATVTLPAAAEELLGLRLSPSLLVEVTGAGLSVRALPLGPDTADLLEAELLPTAHLAVGTGGVTGLIERLAVPLAAQAALDRFDLDRPLFTGGPSAATVLRAAGLLAAHSPRLVVPLPELAPLAMQVLGALVSTGAVIKIDDDLELRLVADRSSTPALLGLGLHGRTAVSGDSFEVSLRLGESAPTWIPDAAPALRLLVIEEGTWRLRPALHLAPLGLRLAGSEGAALVDTETIHLGAVTAYLWASLALHDGFALSGIGGGLDLDDFGLPLGAVSAGDGSSNPVAASLLSSSSGGSGPSAEGAAVTPGLSLVAAVRPASPFELVRLEDGVWLPFAERPLFFPVHRTFGPITVDQIGVAHLPAPAGSGRPGTLDLLVDGGVRVGPLAVEAHELGVGVPIDRLDQPSTWQLDLAGLEVAIRSDSVSMAGGLFKRSGPPIDYLGSVTVEIGGRTLTAVAAYAQPSDQLGRFTSLFVFVGVPAVLGGPPCLFITGLGGGAGYNRQLVLPNEITDVPKFPLVTAIDNGVDDDPMGSLVRMGQTMPPERGSLWLAAGIRFTSFSFVRSVAVVYVTLGRGVEIGLLGVARASIPPPDAGVGSLELAFVELALKARFSPAEGVLSVQAQLTDNSWLLSRDCQLTGGFAFFVWFRRDQFVLTLGGYHPAFVKPAEFPIVPRLGFHWALSDAIVIKGESYFALTSSAVMAGGRLEVSYKQGSVYASFVAYADFLIAWDPFHYDIGVGVSVTAGFKIKVCFFACVTIDVSISLGASVHLVGPPLHGEATLDLEICSVTVEFGHAPHAPPTFLGWEDFREKYVIAGADDGHALSLHASAGLVPPDAVAAASPPGSRDNPWRLAGTFTLRSETRLAATGFSINGTPVAVPLTDGVQPVPAALDLAPMNVAHVTSRHDLTVRSATSGEVLDDPSMAQLDVEALVGHAPAAVWQITGRPAASATVLPVLAGLTLTGHPRVADDHNRPAISVNLIDFNLVPLPIGLVSPPALAVVAAPAFDAALSELRATAASSTLARVGAEVLGAAGTHARSRAGLPTRPISALSARALHSRRSSPPLVAPLAGGVGFGAKRQRPGPAFMGATAVASVSPNPTPRTPLLRLAARPPAAATTAVSARTSVSTADPLPRVQPPAPPSRPLQRLSSASVPPTRAASTGRALLGTGRDVAAGSRLEPGDLAVWDVPAGAAGEWVLSGPGAARIVFLDGAGHPLLDDEIVPNDGNGGDNGDGDKCSARLATPAAAAAVVVQALGTATLPAAAGPGAISLHAAPLGRPPVCGWQSGSRLAQVGPTTLLARGAGVHLDTPLLDGGGARGAGHVLVPAATALASQVSSTTWLPAAVDVVVVIIDATGGESGTTLPEVTVDGATTGRQPTIVSAGHRLYLLDQIISRSVDTDLVAVRVVPGPDWQLAGVLGLPGTIDHWTPTLTAPGSDHLVSDGPLSAAGSMTVRYHPRPQEEP